MLKLFGVTIFAIVFMSVLAGENPAKVAAFLIVMPKFQMFFLCSVLIVLLFSITQRVRFQKKVE